MNQIFQNRNFIACEGWDFLILGLLFEMNRPCNGLEQFEEIIGPLFFFQKFQVSFLVVEKRFVYAGFFLKSVKELLFVVLGEIGDFL